MENQTNDEINENMKNCLSCEHLVTEHCMSGFYLTCRNAEGERKDNLQVKVHCGYCPKYPKPKLNRVDQEIMEKNLREWRRAAANHRNWPPYRIMTEDTIRKLVENPVQDKYTLPKVPGLGPRKIEMFRTPILSILSKTCSCGGNGQYVDREEGLLCNNCVTFDDEDTLE